MTTPTKSLTQYLIEAQREQKKISADLRFLIEVVSRACKGINLAVRKSGLESVDQTTLASRNVHGEVQKKLDILSNQILLEANEWGGHLAAMASEEMDGIYTIPHRYPSGEFLLLFDPLDGSSNIDVNVSIGTIFSVLRAQRRQAEIEAKDFLQAGYTQVAAGYTVYGPQTTLVLSLGSGVVMFTLDNELGSWRMNAKDIRIPAKTSEFAVNLSNLRRWEPAVRQYVDELLAGKEGVRGRDFNMRWIGSMVADVHRLLTRGGIFMYPRDNRSDKKNGHLRLMYEANPMAFIVEQAGGKSSDGSQSLLQLIPEHLHQRVPVFLGSSEEIDYLEGLFRQHS